jgi:hypothetical protein
MKVVRLIRMRLNETYSTRRVRKYLSDAFPIKNGLKQDALSPLLCNTIMYMCTHMNYSELNGMTI